MAVKPFVTMEAGNISAQVGKVGKELDRISGDVVKAAGRALDLLAENMLSEAQAAAPVDTGRLQESGTTEPLVFEGTEIVKRWGFNSKYARIQDQGGTIVPVRAQMLSIPLSDAAKKMASPLEMGKDNLELVPILGQLYLADKKTGEFHWLLVHSVTLEGTRFVSNVVQARKDDAPRFVAAEVSKALGGGA